MDQILWRRMIDLLVNNELESMWKELAVAHFELLFRQLLVGKKKGKVHPCTGIEAMYRLYGP